MAANPEGDKYNFNLSFQNDWNPPELVRKGTKKDPLYKRLRVKKVVNQYERSIIGDIQSDEKKYQYDFAVDDNEIIMLGMSTGKSNMYAYISIDLSRPLRNGQNAFMQIENTEPYIFENTRSPRKIDLERKLYPHLLLPEA